MCQRKNLIDVCVYNMSRVLRKPDFCLGENKGTDQLRSNWEADQCLCFCYTDSTMSLFMPPTLKKLEGHIAFGLSVCVCVRLLTFEWSMLGI